MLKTYILVVGLLLSLALTHKAMAQQELPCDMYLRSAKIYLKQSVPDLGSALKNLLAAPEKCRLSGEIDFMIGGIYADQNVYDKMVQYFDIALKKDPTLQKRIKDIKESKWSEVFKRGAQFLEKADHPQALKHFEIAILIDSSRYEAYYNAGIEALNLDSTSKARLLLEKAYKIVPENLNVKIVYARLILDQNKFQEASKIYEEIVKLDPKNKEALINLAMCYTSLGENQKSKAIYDTAIALGLGDKDLYFNRGLMKHIQAQGITSKIVEVRDSMVAHPNDKALVEKSNQLIAEQKKIFQSAESDFKKVVEMDSTDQEGWFRLGLVQWQLEKPGEAKGALEKVVKIEPQNKETWDLLSRVYTKLGMKKEAENAAQKAKSL